MKVTLTRVTQNPVEAIEEAASNCYDSEPGADGRIMNACYKSGHWAVLEFADFTFHVEGISRALLAQNTRHRIASYAVRSQRYCAENGFEYVTPPKIQNNAEALFCYTDIMEAIDKGYAKLQELGMENEDARMVLPNACHTVYEVKMNGRELINFMNLRLCTRAQWEIRQMAQQMKKCVEEYDEQCAQFAKLLRPKCQIHAPFNFCTEGKCCGKAPKLKDVYAAYLMSLETGDDNE